MSKKRWLASLFALALATQVVWGQVRSEDVVPGEELPFAPVDSLPPPVRTTNTQAEPNWIQMLAEECLNKVIKGWAMGTCPACPVVKAITVDPFGNAARHFRVVVQYSNNAKACDTQCPLNALPPPCADAYGPPPVCGMGGCCNPEQVRCNPDQVPMFGAGINASCGAMGSIVLNERNCEACRYPCPFAVPGQAMGWHVALPGQVNAGCSRGTADKPGCCGNCGCKSCGKSNEVSYGMQMPPFAMMQLPPGHTLGPVLQHAPFAHPCANPWMAQQWLPPPMPPYWGQNVDWANNVQAPQWLEWNHPVVWTRVEEPSQAVYQVVAKGDAVYLNTPNMEAKCQRMTYLGNRDRVMLEGDVRLVCKKGSDVTRIEAPRIMVDLLQGTFTVEAGKGNGPVSAAPSCPGTGCPVPPIGPIGTWGEFWERMCGYGQECDMPREVPQRNIPTYPRSQR